MQYAFGGFVLYEAAFEYEHFIIKAVNALFRFWAEWASTHTNGEEKENTFYNSEQLLYNKLSAPNINFSFSACEFRTVAELYFSCYAVGNGDIQLDFIACALPTSGNFSCRCGVPTLGIVQRADEGRGDDNIIRVAYVGVRNDTCKILDKPRRNITEEVVIV